MLWVDMAAAVLAAGLLAWLWWYRRPRVPASGGGPPADPFAAQVAEFRRAVGDWSRG